MDIKDFVSNIGQKISQGLTGNTSQSQVFAQKYLDPARASLNTRFSQLSNKIKILKTLVEREKLGATAKISQDLQDFLGRPVRPETPLYKIGSLVSSANQTLEKTPVVGDIGYRIPRTYGKMAADLIAEGVKQTYSGKPSKIPFINLQVPGRIAGPAKTALGGLSLTPIGVASSYFMEGAQGLAAPVFGKDSLATMGIGLAAAILTPLPGDETIQGARFLQKLSKHKGLAEYATRFNRVDDFASAIAKKAPKELSKINKDFGSIDNFFTAVQNRKAQIGKVLTEMKGGQTSLKGLFSETPAQTAARRSAGFQPGEVYQGTLEKIRSSKSKFSGLIERADDSFDDFMKSSRTDVKDKVNIFDYLRTPDRVLEKIGLGKQSKQLQKAWGSYLDNLPKEIEKISNWAKEAPGADSNQKIFKYLDGQISAQNLLPHELKVANKIKVYLKGWAEKLGLPEDRRISNYITHIWEKGEVGREFPEDIAVLIRDKVAGSVYDPFVQKRMGSLGYQEDTWKALDAYTKRALRKSSLDPVLENVKNAANNLEDSQYKYVKTYIDRVNLRPGDIDILLDNAFKSVFGYRLGPRPTAVITQSARRAVYRGLLGLNPASALKNISQGSNTYAELGEKYTIVGYSKVAQNFPRFVFGRDTELNAVGVLRDGFIQDRNLTATKQLLKKTDDGLFYMFNLAEKINRGAAYWGSKARALKKGLSETEAIQEGINTVKKTQFTFGSIDTPVALQGDLAKTFAQFQTYSLKQVEFLAGKVSNKEWAGIIRYIGANALFAATIGKLIGFDLGDMIPSFRFGAPPTMQLPVGVAQAIPQDQQNPDQNILERIFSNPNVQKGIVNYIPAGGQARKTFQGTNYFKEGGSYTKAGNLQYPFVGSPFSAALFGKYNNEAAEEYFKSPHPLGENQTKTYKALIAAGATPQVAYDLVTAQRKNDAKLKEVLKEQGSTGENLIQKIFSKKEVEAAPTEESQDPIFNYLRQEAQQTEENRMISEIFKTATSPSQAEKAMQAVGISKTYEEASIQIVKSLNVENRAKYLQETLAPLSQKEYSEALERFVDAKVITASVVDKWVEMGTISDGQGNVLKNFIKMRTDKKLPGIKKPKKLSLGKIKTPKGKIRITVPKFRPVKLKVKKY